MSHFFSSIGKVFSDVWNVIRPVVEVVAIAVAVYWTAGLALSAFPATQAFAAAMPGFASAGGVAGEGVFSSLATNLGVGGGLQAGAAETASAAAGAGFAPAASSAADSLAAVSTSPAADTAVSGLATTPSGVSVGTTVGAGAPIVGPAAGTTVAGTDAASVAPAVVGGGGGAAAGDASSALTNKLLLASLATQTISGLTAPSPTDIARAKASFYGSFYGEDSSGGGGGSAGAPNLNVGPQVEPLRSVNTPQAMPGVNIPATQLAQQQAPGFQGVQRPQLIAPVPNPVLPVQTPTVASNNQPTNAALQGQQAAQAVKPPQLIPTT